MKESQIIHRCDNFHFSSLRTQARPRPSEGKRRLQEAPAAALPAWTHPRLCARPRARGGEGGGRRGRNSAKAGAGAPGAPGVPFSLGMRSGGEGRRRRAAANFVHHRHHQHPEVKLCSPSPGGRGVRRSEGEYQARGGEGKPRCGCSGNLGAF